jgi:hypothetical protein
LGFRTTLTLAENMPRSEFSCDESVMNVQNQGQLAGFHLGICPVERKNPAVRPFSEEAIRHPD